MLVETELKKLKKVDAAYFRGKNYFGGDGTQNYLVFQPMYKYFKKFAKNNSTFLHGNKKDCLMKKLVLLAHIHLIIRPHLHMIILG